MHNQNIELDITIHKNNNMEIYSLACDSLQNVQFTDR